MRDVVFVAMTIGFFFLCLGYIRACARIIGGGADGTDHGEAK